MANETPTSGRPPVVKPAASTAAVAVQQQQQQQPLQPRFYYYGGSGVDAATLPTATLKVPEATTTTAATASKDPDPSADATPSKSLPRKQLLPQPQAACRVTALNVDVDADTRAVDASGRCVVADTLVGLQAPPSGAKRAFFFVNHTGHTRSGSGVRQRPATWPAAAAAAARQRRRRPISAPLQRSSGGGGGGAASPRSASSAAEPPTLFSPHGRGGGSRARRPAGGGVRPGLAVAMELLMNPGRSTKPVTLPPTPAPEEAGASSSSQPPPPPPAPSPPPPCSSDVCAVLDVLVALLSDEDGARAAAAASAAAAAEAAAAAAAAAPLGDVGGSGGGSSGSAAAAAAAATIGEGVGKGTGGGIVLCALFDYLRHFFLSRRSRDGVLHTEGLGLSAEWAELLVSLGSTGVRCLVADPPGPARPLDPTATAAGAAKRHQSVGCPGGVRAPGVPATSNVCGLTRVVTSLADGAFNWVAERCAEYRAKSTLWEQACRAGMDRDALLSTATARDVQKHKAQSRGASLMSAKAKGVMAKAFRGWARYAAEAEQRRASLLRKCRGERSRRTVVRVLHAWKGATAEAKMAAARLETRRLHGALDVLREKLKLMTERYQVAEEDVRRARGEHEKVLLELTELKRVNAGLKRSNKLFFDLSRPLQDDRGVMASGFLEFHRPDFSSLAKDSAAAAAAAAAAATTSTTTTAAAAAAASEVDPEPDFYTVHVQRGAAVQRRPWTPPVVLALWTSTLVETSASFALPVWRTGTFAADEGSQRAQEEAAADRAGFEARLNRSMKAGREGASLDFLYSLWTSRAKGARPTTATAAASSDAHRNRLLYLPDPVEIRAVKRRRRAAAVSARGVTFSPQDQPCVGTIADVTPAVVAMLLWRVAPDAFRQSFPPVTLKEKIAADGAGVGEADAAADAAGEVEVETETEAETEAESAAGGREEGVEQVKAEGLDALCEGELEECLWDAMLAIGVAQGLDRGRLFGEEEPLREQELVKLLGTLFAYTVHRSAMGVEEVQARAVAASTQPWHPRPCFPPPLTLRAAVLSPAVEYVTDIKRRLLLDTGQVPAVLMKQYVNVMAPVRGPPASVVLLWVSCQLQMSQGYSKFRGTARAAQVAATTFKQLGQDVIRLGRRQARAAEPCAAVPVWWHGVTAWGDVDAKYLCTGFDDAGFGGGLWKVVLLASHVVRPYLTTPLYPPSEGGTPAEFAAYVVQCVRVLYGASFTMPLTVAQVASGSADVRMLLLVLLYLGCWSRAAEDDLRTQNDAHPSARNTLATPLAMQYAKLPRPLPAAASATGGGGGGGSRADRNQKRRQQQEEERRRLLRLICCEEVEPAVVAVELYKGAAGGLLCQGVRDFPGAHCQARSGGGVSAGVRMPGGHHSGRVCEALFLLLMRHSVVLKAAYLTLGCRDISQGFNLDAAFSLCVDIGFAGAAAEKPLLRAALSTNPAAAAAQQTSAAMSATDPVTQRAGGGEATAASSRNASFYGRGASFSGVAAADAAAATVAAADERFGRAARELHSRARSALLGTGDEPQATPAAAAAAATAAAKLSALPSGGASSLSPADVACALGASSPDMSAGTMGSGDVAGGTATPQQPPSDPSDLVFLTAELDAALCIARTESYTSAAAAAAASEHGTTSADAAAEAGLAAVAARSTPVNTFLTKSEIRDLFVSTQRESVMLNADHLACAASAGVAYLPAAAAAAAAPAAATAGGATGAAAAGGGGVAGAAPTARAAAAAALEAQAGCSSATPAPHVLLATPPDGGHLSKASLDALGLGADAEHQRKPPLACLTLGGFACFLARLCALVCAKNAAAAGQDGGGNGGEEKTDASAAPPLSEVLGRRGSAVGGAGGVLLNGSMRVRESLRGDATPQPTQPPAAAVSSSSSLLPAAPSPTETVLGLLRTSLEQLGTCVPRVGSPVLSGLYSEEGCQVMARVGGLLARAFTAFSSSASPVDTLAERVMSRRQLRRVFEEARVTPETVPVPALEVALYYTELARLNPHHIDIAHVSLSTGAEYFRYMARVVSNNTCKDTDVPTFAHAANVDVWSGASSGPPLGSARPLGTLSFTHFTECLYCLSQLCSNTPWLTPELRFQGFVLHKFLPELVSAIEAVPDASLIR